MLRCWSVAKTVALNIFTIQKLRKSWHKQVPHFSKQPINKYTNKILCQTIIFTIFRLQGLKKISNFNLNIQECLYFFFLFNIWTIKLGPWQGKVMHTWLCHYCCLVPYVISMPKETEQCLIIMRQWINNQPKT